MTVRAVYPGSFDPVTYGHLDVIKRASNIFDELIVAVAQNLDKSPLFNMNERLGMISEATSELSNVSVDGFEGLLVDYCKAKKAKAVVRGLRALSDFEFEFQMALTNRKLDPEVETFFLMPNESYSYLSSRIIREIIVLGGDVTPFVPGFVNEQLKKKIFDLNNT